MASFADSRNFHCLLMEVLKNVQEPVVGCSYVTEFIDLESPSQRTYRCNLCQEKVLYPKQYAYIQGSIEEIAKLLEKKNGCGCVKVKPKKQVVAENLKSEPYNKRGKRSYHPQAVMQSSSRHCQTLRKCLHRSPSVDEKHSFGTSTVTSQLTQIHKIGIGSRYHQEDQRHRRTPPVQPVPQAENLKSEPYSKRGKRSYHPQAVMQSSSRHCQTLRKCLHRSPSVDEKHSFGTSTVTSQLTQIHKIGIGSRYHQEDQRHRRTPPVQPVPQGPPISKSNIGNKMLQRMGWKPGTGLGPQGNGIKFPVTVEMRPRYRGLGFHAATAQPLPSCFEAQRPPPSPAGDLLIESSGDTPRLPPGLKQGQMYKL